MSRVMPPLLTVMFAVRCWFDVFEVAVTMTEPLFEPEAGETVSQVALLLTVQLILEDMVKICCTPVFAKFNEEVETVKKGKAPVCVTLMV